jgi:hypothetical protein
MIRVVHSGSQIPDPDPDFLPIPDPGIKKAPDTSGISIQMDFYHFGGSGSVSISAKLN